MVAGRMRTSRLSRRTIEGPTPPASRGRASRPIAGRVCASVAGAVARAAVVTTVAWPRGGDEVGPSGVGLDQAVADLYVVMRFAELVQRRVREIVERAVSEYGGTADAWLSWLSHRP